VRVLREGTAVVSLHEKKRAENVALDERVLAAIRTKSGLTLRGVCVAVTLSNPSGSITDRQVDRSLQRLRKKKLIKFGGPGTTFSGWRAT
jgi:hypothetical protein